MPAFLRASGIVVEDALASNGPHIEPLKALDMRFVPGVKPGDHRFLFQWVDTAPGVRTFETTDAKGARHRFRYLNGAPLNDANFELEVNFLEYRETRPNGTKRHFSRVTDLPVEESNLMDLMRADRLLAAGLGNAVQGHRFRPSPRHAGSE